jgi:hypothetical protein
MSHCRPVWCYGGLVVLVGLPFFLLFLALSIWHNGP